MSKPEDYITVAQARKLMGVTVWKMSDILRKKEIPWINSEWDKRVKLIRRADVEAWMKRAGPRIPRGEEAPEGRAAPVFA